MDQQIENINTMQLVPCEAVKEQAISSYNGWAAACYFVDFIKFLKRQTNFDLDNFRTPRHLQKLFDSMAYSKIPLSVWKALMEITMKIVRAKKIAVEHIVSFFIDVTCFVCRYMTRRFVLQFTLFVMGSIASPFITPLIVLIYWALDYFSVEIFDALENFIKRHMNSAIYYRGVLAIQ